MSLSDVRQCKFCGRLFHGFGSDVCPECLRQMDEDFVKVRDYIYEHPHNSDVETIAEETGVDSKVILHLMKEERLYIQGAIDEDAPLRGGGSCQICGAPIAAGKMCDTCKNALSASLSPDKGDSWQEDKRQQQEEKKKIGYGSFNARMQAEKKRY